MERRKWSLDTTFQKINDWVTTLLWDDWDSLEPEERERIENRYEENRNRRAVSLLKKGIYAFRKEEDD